MNNLVILGGGTAGWMAAIAIASRFPEKQVTVIDPTTIGPIGVGESVTGVVLMFVNDPIHQLDPREFFRRCDVTFKAGIWYEDWQGMGTHYLAPIDSPPEYFKYPYDCNVEEFYALAVAQGMRLGEFQIFSQLMRQNKTDHFRNFDGTIEARYASVSCQFDALRFAAWLKEVAQTRDNIRHVDDTLERFEQDEQGRITKLHTRSGEEITGDLFLDCSGFHRRLLAQAYQPAWKSYADFIRVDSAIPCFADYAPGEVIPTYTKARAIDHGWLWEIPTQTRMGKGYLFSSRYVDTEQAVAEMRSHGVDPGDSPRVIRFDPGRFEKQWLGNVCAIGLSGGFIEPLEASTIHGMYVQIRLLTEVILPFCTTDLMQLFANQYNRLIGAALDDYVDFISVHYRTGRDDTDFWRDYQQPSAISPTNAERIEKWKLSFPMREDFVPTYTNRVGLTSGLVLWAPVLCALDLWSPTAAQKVVQMSRRPQQLQENFARYLQIRNRILATALTHAEAIRFCRGD